MSDESDEKVIDFKEKFSISDLLNRAKKSPDGEARPEEEPEPEAGGVPPLDELTALPMPGDPYEPHSRLTTRPHSMLALVFKGIGFKCLSYGNLESIDFEPAKEEGGSPALLLFFAGLCPVIVKLEGPGLRPLGMPLKQHRIEWLREHPTGKVAEAGRGMVIRRITVTAVGR